MCEGEFARDGGFGRPIAERLAAGDDKERREPRATERHRVVQSRAKDRRRPPVVFGRTQDDDRVRGPPLIALPLVPDAERCVAGDGDSADERHRDEPSQVVAH